ncbi:cytochrome-c oxidase, cbb3-type subunit I [Candidatus Thioglobus sp.]|jgi:cytochrome c oxidase cbb3-type subunit 1|uniref:cytochrome-c oxidase, cbb3-type subunit I n=1 Tax=Candidatus Thioglobus sp. TaxID=2026721 RepID=UPI001D5C419A|nr:cytochrome-c oxidase, cbb3-type subunit I [Candidatus Thioglobus sp.]MBT3276482.1 cytochrome-c oxidase, cbb3-type subunit I [Candidatus Thioglobus sp.]MBT3446816.1 cytochrome-c oxidase, cbb3-type subunit I [Candidatus Thioglobus sp.]MBT3744479.1 cytochrome-c oxidase, cbb3-type subunit I [Candidatus Thioglobus sp.]MBT4000543.1 cytochrome-c oxidase, cbb3-type subunit I [Candidatus Thioglobus sp.]MBT4181655.1 cytochrome-c oxidase, cbb3-type subunit I [Candidatus Thioglobus sp.]
MNLAEKYDLGVVKWFTIMSSIYLVVGTLLGVYIASELAFPYLNDLGTDLPYFQFGRLRPLHTNAVVFAFGGSALMAAAFYIVQRTNQVRLWSNKMAWFTFWSWNTVIVLAVVTLPLGLTQSKEYAELEWPIDILITLSWASYLYNFIMTIHIRDRNKVPHVYVANWFFMGMMVMVTYLHVVNNLSIPVDWFKSYSIFSGVQDAMIQWWWGHNAVGFFLTAGFLGIMYYFVPKQAERPIYSYRLSVIHFWALMFGYVWLGAHHLQYTALPDWAGSLGATISLAMIIPSWGGALNGILTLSGAWDRLREDYILRFLIMSLAFYAMSTFEGPVMAAKNVNALSHYTDWTVGHVHSGALGWNIMVAAGALYHMIERMYNVKLNQKLLATHFWIHTIGTVTYIVAMWVSGIMQGLMWRAYDEYGTLAYTFAESVSAMHPYYVMRASGGVLIFIGAIIMLVNIVSTIRKSSSVQSAHA